MYDVELRRAGELEVAGEWSGAARLYRKVPVSGPDEVTKGRILLQLAGWLLEMGKRRQAEEASDIAHAALAERVVEVSHVRDFPLGRFEFFADPDGNRWSVQQIVRSG